MWRPVENAASDISKSWRVEPNEQLWTSVRDPGIIITHILRLITHSIADDRPVTNSNSWSYVMLHMIPINPCDCSHKNISDNSSCLILWCPFHSPRLQTEAGFPEPSSVVQNPLVVCQHQRSPPLGASLSSSFLLINRRMCIVSSPPLPVLQLPL